MFRRLTIIAVLSAAYTGPAHATPERLTFSEDSVVAATQTHLYVRRDIYDNLGSHYLSLHDQHLIEICVETGEAVRFWPLRHMAVNHLATDDLLVPGQVTERDGETRDMVQVLRATGAEPVLPQVRVDDALSLSGGALMRDGTEQLATPFAIRAAGRAQLAILRDAYPPIETEEDYLRRDRIDFYDLYAPGDWDCTLRGERHSLFRAADRVTVAKIYCEDAELSGGWSFHMLIRDEH